MDTARNGSLSFCPSSHRPSHPLGTEWAGEAVCQMDMDRKWLRSGRGYDTPRTIASFFWSHSFLKPFMPGLRPSCSPSGRTSPGR
ncbi:hypothetical protein ABIE67_010146 [Streptomyces sp. V4I8]